MADLLPQPEPPAPAPDATPKEKMAHRLKTKVGKARYKLRKQTVEPVFGIIKDVLAFAASVYAATRKSRSNGPSSA